MKAIFVFALLAGFCSAQSGKIIVSHTEGLSVDKGFMVDVLAVPEETAPTQQDKNFPLFTGCPDGFKLRSISHCDESSNICLGTAEFGCYKPTHCDDPDRILIGPDGNGKYWCHKPQS